jgi:hypothetical protein
MAAKISKTYSFLTIFLIVAIIALLSVIGLLLYRLNLAALPGPPLPGPPLVGPPPVAADLRSVTGVVKGYVHNIHLDVNGVEIQKRGEGLLTFEFRPHTASAILAVAKAGSNVEIDYNTLPNDEAIVYQLHRIKNSDDGDMIDVDQLPPPPRIPPGVQAQTFIITNPQIITDNYGGVAALQAPGRLFHFKPEMVQDIQAMIKKGHNFGLLAVKRGDDQGFINIHHDQVFIVISITIDNKTFMIR